MVRIDTKEVQQFEIEHAAKVRELGAECTLLLKKDGCFPLKDVSKIALYGNGIRFTIKGGTGSGNVYVRKFVNVEEGIKNAGFEIVSNEWLDAYDDVRKKAKQDFLNNIYAEAKKRGMESSIYGMGKVMSEPEYEFPIEELCDTAIYVLSRNSGEGSDRTPVRGDIMLTESEERDILLLNKTYKNFMLVLNVGGMIDLKPVLEVKNILLLGQLGMATGDILADIITGKSYPSGKLTMTWTDIADYPSTEGFADMNDTFYKEGIYVGYRYFETVNKQVLFPFGYGLGYTEFEISDAYISLDGVKASVKAKVTNTGKFAGKEVVQVYYSAPDGRLDKPSKELAGFAKTKELKPGESEEVEVSFDITDMASYDTETASYIMETGDYVIMIGNNVADTKVVGAYRLEDEVVTEKLKNICVGDIAGEYVYSKATDIINDGDVIVIDADLIRTIPVEYTETKEEYNTDGIISWDDVIAGKKTVEDFVGCLTDEELAKLCIGAFTDGPMGSIIGMAAQDVSGAAGQTVVMMKESHKLKSIIMADGPAGLRLSPTYRVINGIAKSTTIDENDDFISLMEPEKIQAFIEANKPTEEELKLPEYYQYCVAIPIGTEIAQTFNVDVAKACGDLVGTEMEMFGVHLWLAPALNIHRSPLCGRNFEYFSEDPLVSGCIAAAITNGVQQHKGCGTTIKHFACNNQETNRYTSNSVVSERALREIYLKGFEICIKESQPHSIMTSYNLINGEHTCNSKDLNTHVLRDEWGYEGFVMTDWFVTRKVMHTPGSKYGAGSAAGCVKAGNDIVMPGHTEDFNDIMDGLKNENHPYHITRADLQYCGISILNKILELVD